MESQQFGTEPSGGFNEVSKAFKANPTIETYVTLRRSNPDAEIEIAVTGGFESMFFMRDEFARFGLDPELLGGILDANPAAVNEVSLSILEHIVTARKLQAAGGTHLASRSRVLPDKLIDWIISCALDAMSWNDDLELSRDLIVLIRDRIGGPASHYEEFGRIREAKRNAAMFAGQLQAQGVKPTLAILGKAFNVAPSTVMRWFEPGELERETDRWGELFDENGQLRPLTLQSDVASEF